MNYWDRKAHQYNDKFYSGNRGDLDLKAKLLRGDSTGDVMEWGCGTGEITKRIAPHVRTLLALDISKEMINLAPPIDNVEYEIGDCQKSDFGGFDLICGNYILMYCQDMRGRIYSQLNHGGRFAFVEINSFHPLAFAKTKIKAVKRRLDISDEAHSFNPFKLAESFKDAGFINVRWRCLGMSSSFFIEGYRQA
jgi:SAM-dependent methyltransferase